MWFLTASAVKEWMVMLGILRSANDSESALTPIASTLTLDTGSLSCCAT
jgi:hypothetical protein